MKWRQKLEYVAMKTQWTHFWNALNGPVALLKGCIPAEISYFVLEFRVSEMIPTHIVFTWCLSNCHYHFGMNLHSICSRIHIRLLLHYWKFYGSLSEID